MKIGLYVSILLQDLLASLYQLILKKRKSETHKESSRSLIGIASYIVQKFTVICLLPSFTRKKERFFS
jgi:hypothetical protein